MNTGAGNLGSPLHIAVVNLKIPIIVKMVDLHININMTDNEGNTPLHQLISIYSKNEMDSFKILKVLVTNGADPNISNQFGLPPLLLAIKKKQKGAIRDILKINKILKPPHFTLFDLNYIDPNTG